MPSTAAVDRARCRCPHGTWRERAGHSLQTTALVNEAYIRLVDYKRMQVAESSALFAVSARLMRRIFVKRARRQKREALTQITLFSKVRCWGSRALHATDAGAPNGPVVVNEAFMRVGRNPVGARVRTVQRGSERELGPWHEIVGVVTDLWTFPSDWGGAAHLYRAGSAAEVDPVVVAVRVAGDAAPLAPRVAALARRSMRVSPPGPRHPRRHRRRGAKTDGGGSIVFGSVLLVAVVFSAAGLCALMAVAVARRTREIGIRLAIGTPGT